MQSPQTFLDLSEGEGGSIDELAGKETACKKHSKKRNRNYILHLVWVGCPAYRKYDLQGLLSFLFFSYFIFG